MRSKILLIIVWLFAVCVSAETPVVILHNNDVHSQLEPLPADDPRNPDMGGILRREAVCRQIRSSQPNVLVFECGDFVQGTPYFNFFKGEAEIELMNYIRPTAVTLGNHEFDNGIRFLAKMLERADFPVVCTNYDVNGTALKKLVRPWLIIKCGKSRIGIISANINPEGLISKSDFEGITWLDPIKTAEKTASWLKTRKQCDMVICLSHLGYKRDEGEVDDLTLAKMTTSIDVILGGHTHTFLKQPVIVNNLIQKPVIINQVGKAGIYLGRLDVLVADR